MRYIYESMRVYVVGKLLTRWTFFICENARMRERVDTFNIFKYINIY